MSSNTTKLFILSLLVVFLSACASQKAMEGVGVDTLRDQGMQEVNNETDFEFGHGVGSTEEDAQNAALLELGLTIFVQVRSEVDHIHRSTLRDEGDDSSYVSQEDLNVQTQSFSNVEISGHRVDVREQAQDGWYVRVRLSTEEANRLRNEIRRMAPLLAYLELLSNSSDAFPGRNLKYAVQGLAEAERLQMSDDRITGQKYAGISYGAYFKTRIDQAIRHLRVLPYMEGKQARLALIHRDTYAPVAGIWLQAGDKMLVTDSEGRTEPFSIPQTSRLVREKVEPAETSVADKLMGVFSSKEPEPEYKERRVYSVVRRFDVLALGVQETKEQALVTDASLLLQRVDTNQLKNPSRTQIYVHLVPENALISVNGDERHAPAHFEVPVGKKAILKIFQDSSYRGQERTLKTAGRGYIYFTQTLVERKYGHLMLNYKQPDSDFFITVFNSQGDALTTSQAINQQVEVGSYQVRLKHAEDTGNYQVITDEPLVVHEGREVSRTYNQPRYREPWVHGYIWGFTYGFASEPGSAYNLPTGYGTEMSFTDFDGVAGCGGQCPGDEFTFDKAGHFGIHWTQFFNRASFALNTNVGFKTLKFKDIEGEEQTLSGISASVGGGFWTSKIASASWVTANYRLEHLTWSDKEEMSMQGLDGVNNGYPYLELGMQIAGLTLGARIPDPSYASPEIFVGLGFLEGDSGYRYSQTEKAREGIHY